MDNKLIQFINSLEKLRKKLLQVTTVQLSSVKIIELIRSFVTEYFESIRPSIEIKDDIATCIKETDTSFHNLLLLSHKKTTVKKYIELIILIKKNLININAYASSFHTTVNNKISMDSIDELIISTLMNLLPSASFSYRQAVEDLQSNNRYSWRGPATDLRESLRETLDYLAPDEQVIGMPGYKPEKDTNGPTMKQKVRYILKNSGISKSISDTTEKATDYIEEMLGSFVRSIYTRTSVSTHTPTDKNEVIKIKEWVKLILCELLEIPMSKI